ncbi:probable ubiquitin-conjugating enzyme E2 26 isoform X3 [Neltuma alba]|nr:probable ubiquitin-conjugating enzyme E2 26 isoform X3 [Prosopis alba]
MDPEVVEIPPPIHRPTKLMKQKVEPAIISDVIDVDNDEDSADLVFIGEKVGGSNKGKEMSDDVCPPPTLEQFGPASGLESSSGYASVSHNIINVDGHSSDLSNDDDDYNDHFADDFMDVDEYAMLQAHFDSVNIPAGIEAPIPWMSNFDIDLKKSGSSSSNPWGNMQLDAKSSHMTDLSQLSWAIESSDLIQETPVCSSSSQTKNAAVNPPPQNLSSQLHTEAALGKKQSTFSQLDGLKLNLNLALGADSSKPHWFKGPFSRKKKLSVLGDFQSDSSAHKSEPLKLPPGGEPPHWGKVKSAKKAHGKDVLFHSNFFPPFEGSYHIPGLESANSNMWKKPPNPPFTDHSDNLGFYYPFDPLDGPLPPMFGNAWIHNYANDEKNETTTTAPVVTISDEDRDEILRKFQHFKQFDTVEDTSDHYYNGKSYSLKQHSKNWSKKIQEEWRILEKDLPDTIFVRVYESRMDLLRAVMIGAEGTPYHDGLFFFDVFFPNGYPNVPPEVHYHSGGVRINPNLYNCGKVCLSLLNTWSGDKNEKWLPGVSTILQVLVSIQGLILNTKPYFNEPGFAHTSGSAAGEMRSLQYNEDAFILSLKTMMYVMRKPPKHFEDFVAGHFCTRAHDILVACKAYMDGAQVGCLVKGGVQDVDAGDRSCSRQFKETLAGFVNRLVGEFSKVGAKECEKFLPQAATAGNMSAGCNPDAAGAAAPATAT